MLNLAIPRDIVSITLVTPYKSQEKGKKVYKQVPLDDAKQFRKEGRDFTLIDGSIIASHQISRIEKATALEEFELFVFPQLSTTVKNDFLDIKLSCEQSKQSPSLNAILAVIEKKKKEREYELTVNRKLSDTELERRRQQVANRPKLQFT